MITIHQRHRRRDGQTDDMQSQYLALHWSASRGKNKNRAVAVSGKPRDTTVNFDQYGVCRQLFSFDTRGSWCGHAYMLKCWHASIRNNLKYEGWSKSSRPDLVLIKIKFKKYLLLIVAMLRTWHAQHDFLARNILYILAYKQNVCQMGVEMLTPELCTKNFSKDTDVTQQKFISQLVI